LTIDNHDVIDTQRTDPTVQEGFAFPLTAVVPTGKNIFEDFVVGGCICPPFHNFGGKFSGVNNLDGYEFHRGDSMSVML
jgi:hypothetical protein